MATGEQARPGLAELLDGSGLPALLELLQPLVGPSIGLVDQAGRVVVDLGPHRTCPPTGAAPLPASCTLQSVARDFTGGGQPSLHCPHGLRRLASPLDFDGSSLGTMVLHSFLHPDEELSAETRARARQQGCRTREQQVWLSSVPRLSQDRAAQLMQFLRRLTEDLVRQGASRSRLTRELQTLEAQQEGLPLSPISEHLEKVVNTLADPLFVKDRQHTWVFLNDAYCEFMGYPREDLLGKSDYDFFPRQEADVFWAKDELVFESGEENLNEEQFTDAEGVTHIILTRKTLYRDQLGQSYIVGIFSDITERKQTEEALIRSQQLAAVGTLAAGIAHEFNNINTSVIGNLQFMLESSALPGDARQLAQRAMRAAGRAADITGRLLGFANPGPFERRPTDLRTIVRATLGIIEREFATEGITLAIEAGAEGPTVLVDPSQISQVLMNLVINARHALLGCAEQRIGIGIGAVGGRAFLRVTDSGCGIRADRLPKIFLPFFSGKGEHAGEDSMQSRVRGSGLGLSISDTIVRNHGGEITVQSELGRGTTFTVWLPLQAQPRVQRSREWRRPSFGPARRPSRILVLEDEADVRELLRKVLSQWGHQVVCSDDGAWALEEHARLPFEVALVDLQMVPMSGFEFLARLGEGRPAVLVITGRLQPGLAEEVSKLGASELLMKPFDLAQLRQSLQRLLEASSVDT